MCGGELYAEPNENEGGSSGGAGDRRGCEGGSLRRHGLERRDRGRARYARPLHGPSPQVRRLTGGVHLGFLIFGYLRNGIERLGVREGFGGGHMRVRTVAHAPIPICTQIVRGGGGCKGVAEVSWPRNGAALHSTAACMCCRIAASCGLSR